MQDASVDVAFWGHGERGPTWLAGKAPRWPAAGDPTKLRCTEPPPEHHNTSYELRTLLLVDQ